MPDPPAASAHRRPQNLSYYFTGHWPLLPGAPACVPPIRVIRLESLPRARRGGPFNRTSQRTPASVRGPVVPMRFPLPPRSPTSPPITRITRIKRITHRPCTFDVVSRIRVIRLESLPRARRGGPFNRTSQRTPVSARGPRYCDPISAATTFIHITTDYTD